MSKALVKRNKPGKTKGLVPAVASGVIPGLGQLINGQPQKGAGVFLVWAITGIGIIKVLPFAGLACAGAWVYGVADGYLSARRKKR